MTIDESVARDRPIAPHDVTEDLPDALIDDDGSPISTAESIETCLRFDKSNQNREDRTSRYEHARHYQYPRILEADRQFQVGYNLTTATFTRRIDPLNDDDELLTPWELNERLHPEGVRRAVNDALGYQLDEFEWEWIGVTATEELSGVPAENLYLWIDDPDNEVTADFFDTAWQRHIEHCPTVDYERNGAIQINTEPATTDSLPEELASIFTHTDSELRRPTMTAHAVAKRLPDLVVGDIYDSEADNPRDTLLEGAAAGWAVPHEWFRTSRGIPSL